MLGMRPREWMLLGVVVILLVRDFFSCTIMGSTMMQGSTTTFLPSQQQQQNGWSTIQVFHGDPHLLERRMGNTNRRWFSQSNQDEIVAALSKNQRKGFFIDLAANDAVSTSNSLGLERNLKWKGLCIEANPAYWRDLAFRDCQVVGAVIGKTRMEQVSFVLSWELGGIAGSDFDNKQQPPGAETTAFYTVPLLEVLQRNRAPRVIDYFSLDVEGAEMYIMEDFPFDQYLIRILTIERPGMSLRSLLEQHGYKLLMVISDFGETLWCHESQMEVLDLTVLAQYKNPVSEVTGLKWFVDKK